MDFFKRFYQRPSSKSPSDNGSSESGASGEAVTGSPFKRIYLSPNLFTDSESANDYVCKICHFMAVDPLEHVPGPNVNCSNIFCLPCVKTYTASGLSSCPAEGCLTSGFDWSTLRELGTREVARLSNLKLNCEFNCSQVIVYRDYWTHREKCPANPENFCEICDSPQTCDTHSCREVFVQLKKKDEALVKENNQLKAEIDKLRRELDTLRVAKAEKMANGTSTSTIHTTYSDNNQTSSDPTNCKNITATTSKTISTAGDDKNGAKANQRPKPSGPAKGNNKQVKLSDANNQFNHFRDNFWDSKSPGKSNGDNEETGYLRGAFPQYKFHSNCFMHKMDHSKLRVIFHYGEKQFKFDDDALPTYTFRTFRSLLKDLMKIDTGIMLLVRHRILHDNETVASCGFRPGQNFISLVPYDTPNFNEAGFRLGLYRLIHATDPLNAIKVPPSTIKPNDLPFVSNEAIDFYSNSLGPQVTEKDINLTFHWNGKDISMERVKRDQTIGSVRAMAEYMLDGDCGKMMYITHQLVSDDMSVKECGFGSGTLDITLLPTSFPINLEKSRTLHLIRFRNYGKMSKKFAGKMKSRTNSMASLV